LAAPILHAVSQCRDNTRQTVFYEPCLDEIRHRDTGVGQCIVYQELNIGSDRNNPVVALIRFCIPLHLFPTKIMRSLERGLFKVLSDRLLVLLCYMFGRWLLQYVVISTEGRDL
jgi:hypothetical protein